MKSLTKNQFVASIIVLILIVGGIYYWVYQTRKEISNIVEENIPQGQEEIPEILSLDGIILAIDATNNFLIIKQPRENKEYKVNLSKETEIVGLKLPFDPANPPKEATFTLKKTEITFKDLKIGDRLMIETTNNIYGKTEFGDVSRVQVLP